MIIISKMQYTEYHIKTFFLAAHSVDSVVMEDIPLLLGIIGGIKVSVLVINTQIIVSVNHTPLNHVDYTAHLQLLLLQLVLIKFVTPTILVLLHTQKLFQKENQSLKLLIMLHISWMKFWTMDQFKLDLLYMKILWLMNLVYINILLEKPWVYIYII